MISNKINSNRIIVFMLYLFIIQNPLEKYIRVIKYVDELWPLLIIWLLFLKVSSSGTIKISVKEMLKYLPLGIFVVVGFLGNILFRYQKWSIVFGDALTNLKFFLGILTSLTLFEPRCFDKDSIIVSKHCRIITVLLFVVFLLDEFFHVFPSGDIRHGIRSEQLFYSHCTYFAGAIVFLIAMLFFFYKKSNLPFILLCLLMLASTMRSKAIVMVPICVVLYYFCVVYRKKLRLWHIVLISLGVVAIAWDQIYFYYFKLSGISARSVMTSTSIQILRDYFPIGTGFGTYGSSGAAKNYSPVYVKYGFRTVYELSDTNKSAFLNDTFWPIIIGQTGFIGTICYLYVLGRIGIKTLHIRKVSRYAYVSVLVVFAYLLICSTSEPAFNNSVAVPFTMIIGYTLAMNEYNKKFQNGEIQW